MAYEPVGVVCYFSAIAHHSLSSQIPSHHHVAVLVDSTKTTDGVETEPDHAEDRPRRELVPRNGDDIKRTRPRANPFGKIVFSYLHTPYHLTRPHKAPGARRTG